MEVIFNLSRCTKDYLNLLEIIVINFGDVSGTKVDADVWQTSLHAAIGMIDASCQAGKGVLSPGSADYEIRLVNVHLGRVAKVL